MRAFKSFGGYYGGNSRSWLLTIVRNTCYTWLQKSRVLRVAESIDDNLDELGLDFADPEVLLLQSVDAQIVRQSLTELPVELREVVVLREGRVLLQGDRRRHRPATGDSHVASGART